MNNTQKVDVNNPATPSDTPHYSVGILKSIQRNLNGLEAINEALAVLATDNQMYLHPNIVSGFTMQLETILSEISEKISLLEGGTKK